MLETPGLSNDLVGRLKLIFQLHISNPFSSIWLKNSL